MTKYASLLLALHTLYVLYLFAIASLAPTSEDPKIKALADDFSGLIKLNCFIFIIWLPLYLYGIGHV